MNITEAILRRHSTRAFLNKEVSREQVKRILFTASRSPSGANTQPWQVAVLSGGSKLSLQNALQQAFLSDIGSTPDYQYYPTSWQPPYITRRRECGLQLYKSVNIEKGDQHRRQSQWAANYRSFDAPTMLLFFMDKSLQTGSYLDFGMFLQSVMLAAMDEGLATCPQAALAEYPNIIREALGYADNKLVICGMALGYEDTQAAVNGYRTPRETLDNFCQFFD